MINLERPKDLESSETLVELQNTLTSLVCDETTYSGICDALIDVKARIRDLTAQRETVLKPLREAEKAVREWFRFPLQTYEMIEGSLKRHVADYQETLRQQKHAAIVAAGQAPTPTAMAQLTALAAPPTPAAISFRKVWKVEITDPNVVPRAFLLIDTTTLRKICQETEGKAQIPGVRFYQEESVAVGG